MYMKVKTNERQFLRIALAGLIGSAIILWAGSASTPSYHIAYQYPIPGNGGWDYVNIDSAARRIYASHGERVEVLDADAGTQIGQILDTPGVHGVALAPELNRGFTSNGGDQSVTVFELQTLRPITKVSVNPPDFILYDSFSQHVFPLSKVTSVLDAKSAKSVAQIDLGGEPEAGVSDEKGTVYINLKDNAQVAVVDAKSLKLRNTFPIANCQRPHSLAYDGANHLLFIGCVEYLAVMDVATGKTFLGSLLCSGVDSGAFDRDSKLIFESCAEGVISVIQQISADSYQLVDTIKTTIGAKTMAFDSRTKRIFLPVADVEIVSSKDPQRAQIVRRKPESFRILVVVQ